MDTRETFFKAVLGPMSSGHVCIASIKVGTRSLYERFFEWPDEKSEMFAFIEKAHQQGDLNIYYCPQLLKSGQRVKENIKYAPNIWADLDTCHPDRLLVKPTVVVTTSPNRFQGIWTLDEPMDPQQAEDISRRIAYHHISDGCDKSGWPLTKLLRVPLTYNNKPEYAEYKPMISLSVPGGQVSRYRADDFKVYPGASRVTGGGIPKPEQADVPEIEDPIEFLQERRKKLNSDVFRLFSDEPSGSWSEPLWRLMLLLFEGGLEREQVYSLARQAACNKYARDDRPEEQLWDDVCRAYMKHMEDVKAVVVPELEQVDLISQEELQRVKEHETFVERYMRWATGLGDAAPQYHEAGAFVILCAIMSGRVSLPTSFGTIIPNLWFMLLANSSMSRKSTSMDIAMDLLLEVDPDIIMATDGSIEGLLQGLSTRPGRPSIFLRDEFSGLLESMTKKDYMAGMAESLTKLYDGKYQKRLLRKEPIEIRDPILILYTGGIRDRIQQLLSLDHVSSGFMPRFIFLTAATDVKRVRPIGPPVAKDRAAKDALLAEMQLMHAHYSQTMNVQVEGTGVHIAPPRKWSAHLSPEAWARYNKYEASLNDAAVKSEREDIMAPVYTRLGVSTLKAAILLAASDSREDEIEVGEIHILHAISFAVKWREYAIDIVNGVGKSQNEKEMERILAIIKRKPGITRSAIMQHFHMTARNADSVFQTLEQRGVISGNKYGRTTTYTAVGKETSE